MDQGIRVGEKLGFSRDKSVECGHQNAIQNQIELASEAEHEVVDPSQHTSFSALYRDKGYTQSCDKASPYRMIIFLFSL